MISTLLETLFVKQYTGVLDLIYWRIQFNIPKLITHIVWFYTIIKLFLQWI